MTTYKYKSSKSVFQSCLIVFFVALCIYLLCALSLMPCQSQNDIFLGIDSGSNYFSLYSNCHNPKFDYMKFGKHPLFDIIVMPYISFINLFIKDPKLLPIICQTIISSLSVSIFYSCLKKIVFNKYLTYIITAIFMLSFSNIIFSSIPERYIYSGIIQVILLYLAINNTEYKIQHKMKFVLIFVLALLSVLNFGINVCNILPNAILCLYILSKQNKNFVKTMQDILILSCTILSLFFALFYIQNKIYYKTDISNVFSSEILSSVSKYFKCIYSNTERIEFTTWGTYIEPIYSLKIIDTKRGVDKLKIGRQGLLRGLFYIDIEKRRIFKKTLKFSLTQNFKDIILFLVYLILPLFYIIKNKKIENARLLLTLSIILLINLIYHYYWSCKDCFLFSQNFLCYLVMYIALLYKNLPANRAIIFCSAFLGYQIYMNMISILQMHQFADRHFHYLLEQYFNNRIIFCMIFGFILSILSVLICNHLLHLKCGEEGCGNQKLYKNIEN